MLYSMPSYANAEIKTKIHAFIEKIEQEGLTEDNNELNFPVGETSARQIQNFLMDELGYRVDHRAIENSEIRTEYINGEYKHAYRLIIVLDYMDLDLALWAHYR